MLLHYMMISIYPITPLSSFKVIDVDYSFIHSFCLRMWSSIFTINTFYTNLGNPQLLTERPPGRRTVDQSIRVDESLDPPSSLPEAITILLHTSSENVRKPEY